MATNYVLTWHLDNNNEKNKTTQQIIKTLRLDFISYAYTTQLNKQKKKAFFSTSNWFRAWRYLKKTEFLSIFF